jgi:hypothetical protein
MAVPSTMKTTLPTEKISLTLCSYTCIFVLHFVYKYVRWCTFEESAADTVHMLASVAQMLLATRRHPENRIKKKTFNETAPPLSYLSAKSMRKSVGKKQLCKRAVR